MFSERFNGFTERCCHLENQQKIEKDDRSWAFGCCRSIDGAVRGRAYHRERESERERGAREGKIIVFFFLFSPFLLNF